ncbi:hypothetical protein BDW69DRAFT_168230 [Aspergillus filifer]
MWSKQLPWAVFLLLSLGSGTLYIRVVAVAVGTAGTSSPNSDHIRRQQMQTTKVNSLQCDIH